MPKKSAAPPTPEPVVVPEPVLEPAPEPEPVEQASATAHMEVRRNYNSQCVLLFSRGTARAHYLGHDGSQLTVQNMPLAEFDREYNRILPHTAEEFARRYTKDQSALQMIPISGSAMRVLNGILGHRVQAVFPNSSTQESNMATASKNASAEWRKPDGPVAQIHAYLDKRLDTIKAGTVSRKELVDALVEKDFSIGTVTTQCGVWARNNGVSFTRPTAAKENKSAARKKAAKKATTPRAKKVKAETQAAA